MMPMAMIREDCRIDCQRSGLGKSEAPLAVLVFCTPLTTPGHDCPVTTHGFDRSHCNAVAKIAATVQRTVMPMTPNRMRRCVSIGVRRRTNTPTEHRVNPSAR